MFLFLFTWQNPRKRLIFTLLFEAWDGLDIKAVEEHGGGLNGTDGTAAEEDEEDEDEEEEEGTLLSTLSVFFFFFRTYNVLSGTSTLMSKNGCSVSVHRPQRPGEQSKQRQQRQQSDIEGYEYIRLG